jgi:hypothetical protein
MKETTAQDGSGSTIAPWDDLRVDPFSHAGDTERSSGRSGTGITIWSHHAEPRTKQEAVDAAGPVDAQNAPTGPWKTADGFPRAPTAIINLVSSKSMTSEVSVQTWPATSPQPLPSSAAVASGALLLTLRRQK